MRNDVCFACKRQGHWMKYCLGKSPAGSQPSSSSSAAAAAGPPCLDRKNGAPSQGTRSDAFFACKKQGHWMKDCPDKSPAKSRPSAADVPVLECPCGASACDVRTFHSQQNSDRKFYKCPGRAPVIHQKSRISYDDITNDLCPVLSVQQLYRICTLYWDDNYNTRSVSPDVISSMRILMTEDSSNEASNSFLLDDTSSIPFSVDDISSSLQVKDLSDNGVDGCDFFAWCNKHSAAMCPYGAGRCRINFFEFPPHKGREYFFCHIRKGHGACEFFQWADSPTENVASIDVATSVIAPPEVMEIESAMADAGEDYEVDPLLMMDSGEIQEVLCRFSAPERHLRVLDSESLIPKADLDTQELAMEDVDLGESTTEQMQHFSRLTSPSPVRLRQQEYLRQISAVGDMLSGSRDTLDMLFGRVVIRWCRRLAFPPCPSFADPSPTPSLCGIFPSLAVDHMDISSVGQSHLESGMDYRNLQFSTGNSFSAEHVSETRSEVSRFQSHPELASNHQSRGKVSVLNQMAKLAQKDIIDLLKKNLLDHAYLEKEARDRLDCLDFLPVDSSQFKEQVKEFLLCASRLAEVEHPTNETAMPNVLERCSRAKKMFHDVSEKYSVTSDAYAVGDGRIKHLREDYHCAKETLLRIEQSCMSAREIERCTARAALEKARLQLRTSLRDLYGHRRRQRRPAIRFGRGRGGGGGERALAAGIGDCVSVAFQTPGDRMDAKYSGEMLKHLEKQNELLMDAYRSMSHELHKLQVEEEMLMRKFYELMSAQGFTKKDGVGKDASGDNRTRDSMALVIKDGDEQQSG
ncbi:hypothetical protein NL676_015244 [Syzygium grande]|nr:hypothetical protein NL676_015244 [Syzygium grande]